MKEATQDRVHTVRLHSHKNLGDADWCRVTKQLGRREKVPEVMPCSLPCFSDGFTGVNTIKLYSLPVCDLFYGTSIELF